MENALVFGFDSHDIISVVLELVELVESSILLDRKSGSSVQFDRMRAVLL